jgi:hypothetical protein
VVDADQWPASIARRNRFSSALHLNKLTNPAEARLRWRAWRSPAQSILEQADV